MAELVLIDTSAWIAFFRGDEPVASLVDNALEGRAALCGVVELELRQGLKPEERNRVLPLLEATVRLPTEEGDWGRAGDLLAALRRRGVTVPSTDGLIAHLALKHKVALVENDGHFEHFAGLKRLRAEGRE